MKILRGEECEYWQLLPSEIKLEEIIKANPPKFVYSLDFFIHLIHLTIEIPAKNKKLRRKDGFVPLSSKILQPKNRNYRLHLDYLVENKILDEQPGYIPGVKSKSYRIAEIYLKDRLIEIMVSDKKLTKHLAKEYQLDFKAPKKYSYLQKWFDDKLEIDAEAAMAYCVEQLRQSPYESVYQIHQKVYGKMFMVKMIQHKQFWFTVDGFGHRLHTNLTSLSSDLRPFVKYDGQSLVSIDIKNSQPYLSLKLLGEKYKGIDIDKIPTQYTPLPIMLVNQPETNVPVDVQLYASLVVNGKLYEFMEAKIREKFTDKYFTQEYIFDFDRGDWVKNDLTPREMTKLAMMQLFFSKNSTSSREKKLFAQLFPNVMRVFEDYKGKKGVPKKRQHKELAMELQCVESSVMLDKVAKKISELRPDLPIFTIHDCVVTTAGNEDFVKQVMEDVISKEIGFKPTLKPEHWISGDAAIRKAA